MVHDICIIGSGAGAAPIAYELSLAGYNVIILEKGKYYKEKDFSKDEISVCMRDKFAPDLKKERHIIYYRGKRYDGFEYNWSFWNGSLVGGSSNLMSGYFHRLKPIDFKLLSTFGPIEGANIVDWPITYEDLEPYYDKVEKIVGVSGKVVKHSQLEPRSSKDFPYPPLQENIVSKLLDNACRELGYEIIPTPRAILSQAHDKRHACYYSNFCGSYGCSSGAKGSARAALLQQSNAKIITDAFVYRLESEGTKVTKAHYFTPDGQSHSVKAAIFVVAAQAHESVRLLLNSKSSSFPRGLANNNDQVGKNLIFSAGGSGWGRVYLKDLKPDLRQPFMQPGLFVNRSIQQWYTFTHNGRPLKGGTIDFLFEHQNIIPRVLDMCLDAKGRLLFGEKLVKKLERTLPHSRVVKFEVFNDWLPTNECYVTLEEDVVDRYGIAVGALHLHSHPLDLEVGNFLAQKGIDVLKTIGAKEIESDISDLPPPNLIAGGCRFGRDRATSVLDPNCKAHEVENLYVTDAAFMPTGGSVPFTWTIYANSFRIADHLKMVLKKA